MIKKTADGNGPLKGILGYTDEPNVSSDFNGDDRQGDKSRDEQHRQCELVH